MKCAVCGVELQENNRFCGICGTPNPDFKEKVGKLPDEGSSAVENSEKSVENNVENVENSDNSYVEKIVGKVENSQNDDLFSGENGVEIMPAVPDDIGKKADDKSVYGDREEIVSSSSAEISGFGGAAETDAKTAEEENGFDTAGDIAPKAEEINTFGGVGNIAPKAEERYVFGISGDNAPGTPETGYRAADPPQVPPAPYGVYGQQNNQYYPQSPQGKPQKEKRVCSLSAVVFCGVVILILSIACGVLGGLYAGERSKRISRTGMSYSESAFITADNMGEQKW